MLSKDQILKAQDCKTETVAVPEWGGDVLVRGLTGRERDAFEDESIVRRGKHVEQNLKNVRARLCVRCIVDDQGNRVFDDKDADALGAKSGAALARIFDAAQRLSGLSAEDVEELAGN